MRIVSETPRLSAPLAIATLALLLSKTACPTPARNGFHPLGLVWATYQTLDLIALSSEQIGTIVVVSSEDSMNGPKAIMGTQKLGYRLLRNIRGQLPAPPLSIPLIRVGPEIAAGDTLLWLRQMKPGETDSKEDTIYIRDQVFDLSDLHRTPFGDYALTRDFRVLRDPTALLTAVLDRITMIEAGRPLGDERSYSVADFAKGRGVITDDMRPGSEADLATFSTHCCNQLTYPADKELLPGFLEQTRDPNPWKRAFAAEALAEYPGKRTRDRLSAVLSETRARLGRSGYQGEDSVNALFAVQAAAIEALKRMRELEQVQGRKKP